MFDELQLGTGFVSRQFQYHAGEVTQEHVENGKLKSTPTTQLVSRITFADDRTLDYEYDAEERIRTVVETYEENGDQVINTTEYTYDALGQLQTETKNGETTKFEYDNYGNITAKGVVDETGEIAETTKITYSYSEGAWKDLLVSYNGQTITYDAQGNPLTYLGHELTWEKGRQLKKFDSNTYTYNANGIRTSKTVAGVKHDYILDGTKILREAWNYDETSKTYQDILIPLYDNEDSVCGIIYNGEPYYFQKNLQGDVISIVDKNSEPIARYSYDAWGVPTIVKDESACSIATINPFRYRSYYFDKEIGMYYLQSRYYDPAVGRFVNADNANIMTIAAYSVDCNLFLYCSNNPINLIDESGYIGIPWQVKVGLAAGVASAIWEMGKYIYKNWYKKKTAWAYIKGLGLAMAMGFIRGFIVGLLSTIRKSLLYGLVGGTVYLIIGLYNGSVKSVGAGISAFMNGWTHGIYSKTLSNVLGNFKRLFGWKDATADLLEYILSLFLGEGLAKCFQW